ncbi:MAG: transporter ATP-binding protein [Rariglobus sp.]|jgi:capsular polysaccharide transport system ATP-binding protein|nr:transporter ATP-binding protein [Rariglobus sp.]
MIQVQNLTKSYRIEGGRHYVFRDINAVFPEDANIGIIGPNGGGKSTFLRLLGGIDHPDSGRIISNKSFSWPLGLKGGFVTHMSGRENCRMVCNLYGLPPGVIKRKLEEIKELSGIGKYFEEPVEYYSSGMGGRVGFALSMAFDFDYFLIDEVTSVGDAQFKAMAKQALEEKAKRSRVIMVSHNMGDLKRFCDMAVLVSNGGFRFFDNLDDAIRAYLPQSQESKKEVGEIIQQAAVEEIRLDDVKLPETVTDHLGVVETALASIERKLALPNLRLPSNEARFFYALATAYEKLGDQVKARDCCQRAVRHDPYHLKSHLKLASMAAHDRDTAALQKAVDAAEAIDPAHPEVLTHRMRLHLRAGASALALEKNDAALHIRPQDPDIWHLRAQILTRINRTKEAIEAQLRAVHYDLKNPARYTYLASLLATDGNLKTSQLAAHKARLLQAASSPSHPDPSLEKVAHQLQQLDASMHA